MINFKVLALSIAASFGCVFGSIGSITSSTVAGTKVEIVSGVEGFRVSDLVGNRKIDLGVVSFDGVSDKIIFSASRIRAEVSSLGEGKLGADFKVVGVGVARQGGRKFLYISGQIGDFKAEIEMTYENGWELMTGSTIWVDVPVEKWPEPNPVVVRFSKGDKSKEFEAFGDEGSEFALMVQRFSEGTKLPDPVSVVMAIDNSGSMQGEKIADVQKAGEIFVSLLNAHDRTALMSFNNNANVLSPLADLSKDGHETSLVSAIQRITAGGGTDFGPPLAEAARILSDASKKKLVLFLSDGNAKFPEAQVGRLIDMGVPICTIGFGDDCNTQVLTQIASRTNGYFYPADRISLPQVFAQISGRSQGSSDLLLKKGIIRQGNQIWEKIVLPSLVETLTLVLDWQGSDLGFLIETPDGTLITHDNHDAESRIESISFPEKHSRILKIHGAEGGIWRIGVDALDVPSEGEPYTLTASCSGVEPVVIQPFAPEYSRASKVPVAITLPDNVLSGGDNVNATISTPSGYEEKLALQDNGKNADLMGGDGTFSGWYEGGKAIGFYDVEYEIENSSGGTAPIWLANASFQVGAFSEIQQNDAVALDDFQRMLQMIRGWTKEARELKRK